MIKTQKKNFWILSIVVVLSLGGVLLFLNDDLRSGNITSHLSPRAEWASSPWDNEENVKLNKILSQPFIYLGEGGQAYVFASADQEFVLKLFKFKRFRPTIFVSMLPDFFFHSYREAHKAKREQKLVYAFNGHKIAFDEHRQESGLLYIQLNPSNKQQLVSLSDKWGFDRIINLEKVSYVIQEKGELLSTVLTQALDRGDISTAQNRIRQLFDLYHSEYAKGIYDLDHGIMHNIGCLGDRVFHMDVGKMVRDERIKQPAFYREDLIRTALTVKSWIYKHYPQYENEMVSDMQEKLSAVLSEGFSFIPD
jgi:hypothetical protein